MMNLPLSTITDSNTRSALNQIQDSWNKEDIHKGGLKLLTLDLDASVTSYRVPHRLGFIPKDIITTKSTGTYTWSYDLFTKDYLVITSTSAISIRCLIGNLD